MKTLGWKAEREHPSREYAAAWIAQIIVKREATREKKGMRPLAMEQIALEAEERAKHARISVADIPEDWRELDQYGVQELQDSEGAEPHTPADPRLARDMAGSLCPLRHAQAAEHEIDLLIQDADGSEGGGL